jgi:hypothetical protein
VLNGYASCQAAERDYGVVIRSTKLPNERVNMPEHFNIDWNATRARRATP